MRGKRLQRRTAWVPAEVYPPSFRGERKEKKIVLGHGAGGMKMHRLIERVFLKYFGNPLLERLEDGAILNFNPGGGELCFTTDSYVVKPLFFPGGDIGKLAVCGTVNDLAVLGAVPGYLSLSFILGAGLEMAVLERICATIARMKEKAGVEIVTGDTKVIEGAGGEVYINTTGIGVRRPGTKLGAELIRAGDMIVINGGIGEHEAAIAISRGADSGGYRLKSGLKSDCAALHRMIQAVLECGGVRVIRDPTRGGLATTLNEWCRFSELGLLIAEERLLVSRAVQGVADLLGLDPLYMANEGKVVMVVAPERAETIVKTMQRFAEGRKARVIGEVVREPKGVWLKTRLGSLRRLLMLEGEQLPRIC